MSASHLPIVRILDGHTQSLFQALRLLNESSMWQPLPAGHKNIIDPQQLLELAIAVTANGHDQPRVDPQPLLLQKLILQQPQPAYIAPEQRATLWLVDTLLTQLWRSTRPHQAIAGQLQQVCLLLGGHLLLRPDLIIDGDHPLTRLVAELFGYLSTWEPAPGRRGKQLADWLALLPVKLQQLDISQRAEISQLAQAFQQLKQTELTRAQALEKRFLDREMTTTNVRDAQQSVVLYIDQRLAGKALPEDIGSFIKSTLVGDLQFLVINQGVDAAAWKQWKRLLQVLSWAFAQPANPDAEPDTDAGSSRQKKKAQTLLPPLIEQLDERYFQEFSSQTTYQGFFDRLIQYFIKVLQGHSLDCVEFTAIAETAELRQSAVVVDQAVIQNLQHFKAQDWFTFTTGDGGKFAGKLLYKEPRKDSLVFSGPRGNILSRYNFEEFGNALALKFVVPINPQTLYRDSLRQTLRHLNDKYQQLLSRDRQQSAAAARLLAAEKAACEARELQQQNLQPGITRPRLTATAINTLERRILDLNCGAWLLLSLPPKDPLQIKLSVKLQNAGKFIFTDRVGHRVAEYPLDELVQLLASGKLQILSQGKDFENSLEKIVRGLRKNNNE